MKKISILLLLLFVAFTQIIAQKARKLSEYSTTLEFVDIKMMDGSDAKTSAAASKMMKDMKMELHAKGNNMYMNMKMSSMMDMKMFMNAKDTSMRVFMSMLGQKIEIIGMDSTFKAEIKKKDKNTDLKNVKIKENKNIKKEILGHTCYQVVMNVKNNPKYEKLTMYIDPTITYDRTLMGGMGGSSSMIPSEISDIEGTPFEIIMESKTMYMDMMVTQFSEKVDAATFTIPTGYTKKDMKGKGF